MIRDSLPLLPLPICLIDMWCCRRNLLKADMMMMVCARSWSASSKSHIRISSWWCMVAAFLVPSFFLRIIRPSASERGRERHANVFRGARDYAAFLAAGAKRGRQPRASEDLAWPTNLSTANINMINLIRSSAGLELLFHKRHGDV